MAEIKQISETNMRRRLADHGVRKYDSDLGQFTSVDPLWEKLNLITNYELRMTNEK